MTDYYAVLGVTEVADDEVIAAAYRALAKKYHPDTGSQRGTASAERFREIQQAFEVLGSQRSRAEYDRQRNNSDQSDNPADSPNDMKDNSPGRDSATSNLRADMPSKTPTGKYASSVSIAAIFVATAALALSAFLFLSSHEVGIRQASDAMPNIAGGEPNTSATKSLSTSAAPSTNTSTKSKQSASDETENLPTIETDGSDYTEAGKAEINQTVTQGDHGSEAVDLEAEALRKKQIYSRIVGEYEIDSEDNHSTITQPQMPHEQGKGSLLIEVQPPLLADPAQN